MLQKLYNIIIIIIISKPKLVCVRVSDQLNTGPRTYYRRCISVPLVDPLLIELETSPRPDSPSPCCPPWALPSSFGVGYALPYMVLM